MNNKFQFLNELQVAYLKLLLTTVTCHIIVQIIPRIFTTHETRMFGTHSKLWTCNRGEHAKTILLEFYIYFRSANQLWHFAISQRLTQNQLSLGSWIKVHLFFKWDINSISKLLSAHDFNIPVNRKNNSMRYRIFSFPTLVCQLRR